MFVNKEVKSLWNKAEREVGKVKCILIISKICKRAQWDKCFSTDLVCDFKIKSKTAWVVLCDWIHPCRLWQNKLAFASGVAPGTNQFLCSWKYDAVELMEVSLLLWSDQLLRVIPNGFGAQRSLLISHFHSYCHSSGPYYLLSRLPAALITFGLSSLKITLQSSRFLKLPFYHVTLLIKSLQ